MCRILLVRRACYIYIYIYREREREGGKRDRGRDRQSGRYREKERQREIREIRFGLVLFNSISTFVGYAKAILVEDDLWYYLIHKERDKGIHTIPKGISSKLNVTAHYDVAVQHIYHYVTGFSRQTRIFLCDYLFFDCPQLRSTLGHRQEKGF